MATTSTPSATALSQVSAVRAKICGTSGERSPRRGGACAPAQIRQIRQFVATCQRRQRRVENEIRADWSALPHPALSDAGTRPFRNLMCIKEALPSCVDGPRTAT
jgi:hypothetical protein